MPKRTPNSENDEKPGAFPWGKVLAGIAGSAVASRVFAACHSVGLCWLPRHWSSQLCRRAENHRDVNLLPTRSADASEAAIRSVVSRLGVCLTIPALVPSPRFP